MTRAFKNIHTDHFWSLYASIACLFFIALPVVSSAQAGPASRKDLVSIALKDNYSLTLRFNAYPRFAFDMWLPELAIFDSDLDRSQVAQPIEGVWLGKWQGNLQVEGRLTTGNKGMDFMCTLKPLTGDAIMLDLEVSNSGQVDWNDYAQLAVCLAPSEGNHAFSDKTGERSYVSSPHAGIQRITKAGVVGDFNHYAVEGHSDPGDTIQRAQVKDGFVARQSADGQLTLSFMWDEAARVDVNPGGLDCIHSDPAAGPLKAGETKILHGFIMIGEGTVKDRYTAMQNLIKEHRAE
jgi:hypothetical protein